MNLGWVMHTSNTFGSEIRLIVQQIGWLLYGGCARSGERG